MPSGHVMLQEFTDSYRSLNMENSIDIIQQSSISKHSAKKRKIDIVDKTKDTTTTLSITTNRIEDI